MRGWASWSLPVGLAFLCALTFWAAFLGFFSFKSTSLSAGVSEELSAAFAGLRSHLQVARLPDRLLHLGLRLASLSPHCPSAYGRWLPTSSDSSATHSALWRSASWPLFPVLGEASLLWLFSRLLHRLITIRLTSHFPLAGLFGLLSPLLFTLAFYQKLLGHLLLPKIQAIFWGYMTYYNTTRIRKVFSSILAYLVSGPPRTITSFL